MSSSIVTAIGVGAAVCSMSSFVPQAAKIWREKDAEAVSLPMYAVTVAGFSLWIAYGVLLKSWPLVGSNAVCLALSALILGLTLRYQQPSAPRSRRRPQGA